MRFPSNERREKRPRAIIIFGRLSLVACLMSEIVFFCGAVIDHPADNLNLSPLAYFFAWVVAICISFPILFLFFGIPYWLSQWIMRGKSGFASLLLHLYVGLAAFALLGGASPHRLFDQANLIILTQEVVLMLSLVFYWAPESRDWMRTTTYASSKQ